MKRLFFLLIFFIAGLAARSQEVLVVIAHPDDENACAATLYKITHELKGHADVVVITNGEGGYKYSTLAEAYYQLPLTDEKTGRKFLPEIRMKEMKNAGKILGIRDYFFLGQWDKKYTTDERDPLDSAWNVPLVKSKLTEIAMKKKYDFVFCMLPVPGTHGHHKAASMLILETVKQLPEDHRPVVLGFNNAGKADSSHIEFTRLKEYEITAINKNAPVFVFDRSVKFGYNNALTYEVVVNWEIAEHKSQGTMQMDIGKNDLEKFWYFDINNETGIEKTRQLFESLKKIPYPVKSY